MKKYSKNQEINIKNNYQGGTRRTCVLHWHTDRRIWEDKTPTHLLRYRRMFSGEAVQIEQKVKRNFNGKSKAKEISLIIGTSDFKKAQS